MQNRRAFLKTGSALAAGGFVNLNPRAMGANEKVTLALIGGRNQGRLVALRAIEQGGQFKTFCDLDPAILEKVGADIGKGAGQEAGAGEGLPARARGQGHRRRDHRHARPLARRA